MLKSSGQLKVAVVGAGVAGCAAAVLLRRAGHAVQVFEAVAEPAPIGAGVLLQPTGLQVLGQLGLRDEMVALGAVVHQLVGDTATGRSVLDMDYRCLGPEVHGLGAQRGALMGLLWQALRASGADWHCGVAVDGFAQDDAGVTLRQRERELGRFDLLVLANGTFSQLRRQLTVPQRETLFPWGAVWCVLPQPEGAPLRLLRQRFRGARQMLGLMPVGRPHGVPDAPGGVNLFWSLRDDALKRWQAQPDAAALSALRAEMQSLLPEVAPLLAGLTDPAQLRVARYADVRMQHWHQGRVVALGDCAHGMSPQLGQGANMALIDAWVLSQCLSDHGVPVSLAEYSRRRRAHLRFYQSVSRWLTPLFQSDQRLGPGFRDAFFGTAGRLPWIKGQSMATLSGMKSGWLLGRLDLAAATPPPYSFPMEQTS
ncbi:FAD-dependent monooxygenase [Ideonella azotifigens]|uniref:NAD(P)/FAD-dependent oxidoreductase n=3 Tax=Ideonella azotifigens TaxID=513160 RepID=A0ABN1KCD5_9BURK|nr:NAD(P)/FAD-dependent oxidoreductase [Ideonella azotifigens]MCD2343121.1 FAD-dependent monooxygenase [Ideonella azotifigens]